MKMILLISTLLLSGSVFAQTANVKDIDASQDGSTTIEITKNKKTTTAVEKKWEIHPMEATIEGEAGATQKDAKAEWTKKCKEWRAELKEQYKDDKENKLLSSECGSASCSGDAGSKVCTSSATYKLKTLMNQ